MKKNSKKIGRLLVKSVIYLAMFGLFAGFVVFLNQTSQEESEEEMTWKPEAVQGIPEGWEPRIRRWSCILNHPLCSCG